MSKLLILGGTTEARLLCDAITSLPFDAIVSLAGSTKTPANLSIPVRTGGFGGPQGLKDWLLEHNTDAVIDATHPFAAQMPWHAFQACLAIGVPRVRIMRPPFQISAGTRRIATLADAISHIPEQSRVLITTGRRDVETLRQRPDLHFLLRTIEPVDDLPSNVTSLLMRPPFALNDEIALLRGSRIDVVIAKDSGGNTAPKLTAADQLGLGVILMMRPEQPPGPTVQTVEQAVAWLTRVVGFRN